jgi:cytochrome c peroxidase
MTFWQPAAPTARGRSARAWRLALLPLPAFGVLGCGSSDVRIVERAGSAPASSMEASPIRPSPPVGPAPAGAGGGGASPPSGGTSGEAADGTGGGAEAATEAARDTDFAWRLPPGFPLPYVPPDNPMTTPKVELGRHLFYDERLSDNETIACATCHRPELAFTDGRAVTVGSTGQPHSRGAMSLANVAYSTTLTWSHPYMTELERQSAVPLFGDNPVELGFGSEAELVQRLSSIAEYEPLFGTAFPGEPEPISALNVARALSTFERTLISGNSAYDRWSYGGEESALSDSARRGFELFFSERLECFHCHLGFTFSDQVRYSGQAFPAALFHNTGLYNIDDSGAYPAPNTGIFDLTQDPADMGKFKAPTLRNIALTAPYMHDGSIGTLGEVLDHYAAGGRTISDGPNAGAGSENPLRSDLIRGFELSASERVDVIAFLEALTDDDFINTPAYQDPWSP